MTIRKATLEDKEKALKCIDLFNDYANLVDADNETIASYKPTDFV